MTNGVEIKYGDVAPEAKENFDISAEDCKYSTLANLKKYNMVLTNFATPCDYYNVLLNGNATALPENPNKSSMGLWSESLTNANGEFETPIEVTLESKGQYSSQGFTFTFDTFNNIYPTGMAIKWIRETSEGITVLDTKTFSPDSAFYFCRNAVENFNKVVITFYELNMPKTRLKLEVIDYGYGTIFTGSELRNVSVRQGVDPISSSISIDTCGFTLDSKSDMIYSFQRKQPISVYFNSNLVSTVFIKSSTRKGKFLWTVTTEDYIGIMDSTQFNGNIYSQVKAGDILKDVFNTCKVPYEVDESISNTVLSGRIPVTSCREALKHICFACKAVVKTSGLSVVKICYLDNGLSQKVEKKRIRQGQSFTDDDTVTSVELTAHTYRKTDETADVYKAEDSGTGNNIFVSFSDPMYDLTISGGEILSSTANMAIINATSSSCILSGKKYKHDTQIKRKKNLVVLESDLENVVSITEATLVSPENVDSVLEHCYDWLVKTETTKAKIVEGKYVTYGKPVKWGELPWGTYNWGGNSSDIITYDTPIFVGDKITMETEYLGDKTGIVTSESFSLNGNILVKDVEMK